MAYSVIVTCEHAGNEVPKEYTQLFNGRADLLNSHEGWDPGAWEIAQHIASAIQVPLFGCLTTRLLIEANRSLNNPQLFSTAIQGLKEIQKERLISEIYLPYRRGVETQIQTETKTVLHFSMHTFTPIWKGKERKTDIGILFDPARSLEVSIAEMMKQSLTQLLPTLNIDFNEPYLGIDDGFTTFLREKFTDNDYSGIEIEVNQKYVSNLTEIKEALTIAIRQFLK